ncbi:M2 family metallopeptidase [Litorimonas haliclonae]|uniref:M2 family metallopeptidase n=1 Tax=Litorimonas haliclonae TaxID=2081977 RepID=UPI0039EEE95D
MKLFLSSAVSVLALTIAGCGNSVEVPSDNVDKMVEAASPSSDQVTVQDAKEFLENAEQEKSVLNEYQARVDWVNNNFITEDTNWLAAKASEQASLLDTRLANEAKQFNDLSLPEDMRRKMDGLKRASNFPAPERQGAAKELSEIMTGLNAAYGTGKFEYKGEMITLTEASDIIAESDDPEELKAIWEGWRTISVPMKDDYARMVEIVNEGSQELGYADAGALWRGGYDMDADEFIAETNRLWEQVKPLYDQLHCNVRAELNEKYGNEVVPLDEPIRADLLGNMWAQQWGNVYETVAPEGAAEGVDTTKLLEDNDYDALKMVQTAEKFFTSMGFEPLPETFYERSLITKPEDREVVCHASAWDIDEKDDIRIKMCTKVNGEDFSTVHHELGHNFYQRAYKNQPVFYRNGANDGFHEAIGDMVALSITPEYLVKIGLLDESEVPGEDADLALLMRQAMDKVAFVPFGLMVDQWRWKVFSGELTPANYNEGWWELREEYQGVKPPAPRPADAFDPGAKYHIPGNTPYMRYFLAHILQFQFHKAACDAVGFEGPLHRCSVYGNQEVGEKFNAMLEMGASKPWPDALEAFTGSREMDGSAILEYFEPLQSYLEEQNENRTCGW